MQRIAIALLLLALALPYVRAPLCQAGSHDHGEHHQMAGKSAFDRPPHDASDAAAGCHALMGCTVVLQTSLSEVESRFRSFTQTSDPILRVSTVPIRSRASPDTPPPRIA